MRERAGVGLVVLGELLRRLVEGLSGTGERMLTSERFLYINLFLLGAVIGYLAGQLATL